VLFIKYYSGDEIKTYEIGGARSTHGGEERCIQGFGGESWGKENDLEYPGVGGRIILKWIFR
jgi:hypothetical protein